MLSHAEQQLDRGRVLVFTVHSPRALHQSVPCLPPQQQHRAGALTLSSSCLDGSVTPVGPGLNPQYTGAPKAGGGCGLLAKSTTTSPMAQPQCGNVNMIHIRIDDDREYCISTHQDMLRIDTIHSEYDSSENIRIH